MTVRFSHTHSDTWRLQQNTRLLYIQSNWSIFHSNHMNIEWLKSFLSQMTSPYTVRNSWMIAKCDRQWFWTLNTCILEWNILDHDRCNNFWIAIQWHFKRIGSNTKMFASRCPFLEWSLTSIKVVSFATIFEPIHNRKNSGRNEWTLFYSKHSNSTILYICWWEITAPPTNRKKKHWMAMKQYIRLVW